MGITPFQSFKANGKLLLTGEYAVLDGALALALPCRFGQSMKVYPAGSRAGLMRWQALDAKGQTWLTAEFRLANFAITGTNEPAAAERLQSIFRAIRDIDPAFLVDTTDVFIETQLEFPADWGLGSSSTLISLLASWTHIDPFLLSERTFGGSGYDIACATADSPILFQRLAHRPHFEAFPFQPSCKEQLYFVHLGQKKDSRKGIAHYRSQPRAGEEAFVKNITQITEALLSPALTTADFLRLLGTHEDLLSGVLGLPKVKDELFSDYWGLVKSLGAWGGDFVLVHSERNENVTKHYFHKKGYPTLLKWTDMLL